MGFLTENTSGSCKICLKDYDKDIDRVYDLLENAGFETSQNIKESIIFGDNFDKKYKESEIFELFSEIEDLLRSAEFRFSDFIVGEGDYSWYFKYEDGHWFSGEEKTIVDYSEIAIPGTMSKEFRTVTDIQWSPDAELLMDTLEDMSEEKAAKGMELPLERYHNMTYEERLDYLDDMLRHNRCSDYMLTEVLDMPNTVILPKEVVREAIEAHDDEVISDYLSDEYGFFHEGFSLSEELEAQIAGKELE